MNPLAGLVAAAMLLGPAAAQLDWVRLAEEFRGAWERGRLDLSAPWPQKAPIVLPAQEPALEELSRARGDDFYWSAEQELSFVITGLAASTGEEALDALFALARVQLHPDPAKEFEHQNARRRQPWLIRDLALEKLRALQAPGVAARARALLADAERSDSLLERALALYVLGARGALEDVARLQPLLADPDPRVRVAAATALGELAYPQTTEPLRASLEREGDPRVRRVLVQALFRALAASATPAEDQEGPFAEFVHAGVDRLGTPDGDAAAQTLFAQLLWEFRPLAALPRLPDALGRLQSPAAQQLRDVVHALLVDMHGEGFDLKERRGKRGTGFAAGADEPDRWREFVAGRSKLYVQRRYIKDVAPPPPPGTPELFGMPLRPGPLTLLVDASAPWSGPWWRQEKSGASGTPDGESDDTLGTRITRGILEALAALPAGTPIAILTTEEKPQRFPRTGHAPLDERALALIGRFLERLRGRGDAAPADALLAEFGITSGLPVVLTEREDPPAQLYWIVCGPPLAGRTASLEALVRRIAAVHASAPIALHVAFFPDRRREARSTPLYQLAVRYGQSSRLRALAERTRGSYHWQGFPSPDKTR